MILLDFMRWIQRRWAMSRSGFERRGHNEMGWNALETGSNLSGPLLLRPRRTYGNYRE
jgi:hypothetical protein